MHAITPQVKVVLLGEPGVGKSSLMIRFVSDDFSLSSAPTTGSSYMLKLIEHKGKQLKLNIWDTAGQERYHSLAKIYLRDADAAILVYDITNKASFEGLKRWHSELVEVAPKSIIIALAGNKEDLVLDESIDPNEVHEYAQSFGGFSKKISCKTKHGIEELFQEISIRIFNKIETSLENHSFQLKNQKSETKKKKKCC